MVGRESFSELLTYHHFYLKARYLSASAFCVIVIRLGEPEHWPMLWDPYG